VTSRPSSLNNLRKSRVFERTSDPVGLYVHVPFCLTRCGYCDFNAHAGLDHLKSPYVGALLREADMTADEWADVSIASIFLGGGTPTTLPSGEILRLLEHLRERFEVEPGAEVTSEANPDTVDVASLKELRASGITRLSMGVQSFDPKVLEALERIHSPESARRAFTDAREGGFDDVNLDFIYGARGETIESWRRTVEEAIALRPEHLSCYALTIEPGTPLGAKVAGGEVPPPDPDLQAAMFEVAGTMLAEAGYRHYEVSNWALPGRECVHNLGYWEGRPYLGLGAGAHSYRDRRRWWNIRPPARYIELALAGSSPIGGEERLTEDEERLERVLLGIRSADGLASEEVPAEAANLLVGRGMATLDQGRLVLTERGMLLANEAVLALSP
jgi:oxygen-independent coproporphyrinogen-3 oxidase